VRRSPGSHLWKWVPKSKRRRQRSRAPPFPGRGWWDYQHCKEKHLHRYLAEFDFRYSNRVALGVNDVARADRALKGIVGKRLTYETPHK
jgi:hypothetical protein